VTQVPDSRVHKLEGPKACEASSLLHHLLNQTLSSINFCILWQELVQDSPELKELSALVEEFLETASLTALDQALALLPEPEGDRPDPLPVRPNSFDGEWSVSSSRIRDVSRADFRCTQCGFEITLSMEHPPNTEMRLPFDNLRCPICLPPGQ